MEQELRFGLDLADWQYWKKGLGRLWENFVGGFFMFSGAKKMFNFLKKRCSIWSKKFHKMKLKNYFSFLKIFREYLFLIFNRLRNISIVSCSIRVTSPWDLSIMTLSLFWQKNTLKSQKSLMAPFNVYTHSCHDQS